MKIKTNSTLQRFQEKGGKMIYTRRDVIKRLVLMLVVAFVLGWFSHLLWIEYRYCEPMRLPTRSEGVTTFLIKLEDEIDAKIRLYRAYVKVEKRLGDTGQKW